MLVRSLVLAAAMLAAYASTALAIPTVTHTGLQDKKPAFTFTSPEGETMRQVIISRQNTVNAQGQLTKQSDFFSPEPGATSVVARRLPWGGTNYWNFEWHSWITGIQYAPVQSFVVPWDGRFSTLSIMQHRRNPTASSKGRVYSNAPTVTITCTVKNGSKFVSSGKVKKSISNVAQGKEFLCSTSVPEKLDGKRLTMITATKVGTKKVTTSQTFTAK